MNRQTLAVTIGTVLLLLLGAVMLYSSPEEEAPAKRSPKPADVQAAQAQKKKDQAQPRKKQPPPRPVFKAPIPADRAPAAKGAPNVVLVTASSIRRDQVTAYDGGPHDTMPFLAEMAKAGVRFDDALANGVWPKSAQVALLTGRLPMDVGTAQLDKKPNQRRLPQEVETLAERFVAGGYHTLGVTSSHYLNGRFSMRQGFDWYREATANSLAPEARVGSRAVVQAALQGVKGRKDKDRPVYLQLTFSDTHKPFRIPPEEFKAFDGEDHNISPYRAMLHRQDDSLKALVQGLEKMGIDDTNTVFVFVGEHGEGLGLPPAHRKQHGRVLYASSVSIPWVMWGKGLGKGATVRGLASQIDLAPTLLSHVDLPAEGMRGMSHHGVLAAGGETRRKLHYADTTFEGTHRASMWSGTHQCQKDYGSDAVDDEVFETGCFDRLADPEFSSVGEGPLMADLDKLHSELLVAQKAAEARAAEAAEQ